MYTQDKEAVYEEVSVFEQVDVGNSKLGLAVIMTMAGFLGLWGTICLVSGLSCLASVGEIGRTVINALFGV